MQDMEDKDLETLFREMRATDHRSATRFERDWDAARSRVAPGHRTSFNYAVAAGCIIAIVLGVAVVVRVAGRRSSIPQQSALNRDLGQEARDLTGGLPPAPAHDTAGVSSVTVPGSSEPNPVPTGAGPKRRARHQYIKPGAYDDRELLSAWRSPTEFLLRSPANDLLKAVPSIQDSMVRIDAR
jgi:hypothetical protein